MSHLQPTPEDLLRTEYLDLRDQLTRARLAAMRYRRLLMVTAAGEAERQAEIIRKRLAAVEAKLNQV